MPEATEHLSPEELAGFRDHTLDPQATPEPSARLKIPVPEPQAKCASVL